MDQNEARLHVVENAVQRIEQAVTKIAVSMEKLARLEERHSTTNENLAKAVERIDELEDGMRQVEIALPMLKEGRRWMITGVLAIIGAVGYEVLHSLLHKAG
jgi:chromosome segregation ATPase